MPQPGGLGQPTIERNDLPQRVPAEPDVPEVPLSDADSEPPYRPDRGELSRIATYLRDRPDGQTGRGEGFDVAAVLTAVRGVPGVRDAQLRWNPDGAHTLRLDLVDGADAGQVSREVARLLRERMGLDAEPNQAGEGDPADGPLGRSGAGSPVRAAAAAQPLPHLAADRRTDATRVVLEHVQVTTLGADATVDVRLTTSAGGFASGTARGPAVDAYLLRLAAAAAASAVDQLLVDRRTNQPRGRVFVEHVAVVPFGGCEVAIVVLLLVRGRQVEQLAGSALVAGDPRQAVVRATLSALNRRLEALIPA